MANEQLKNSEERTLLVSAGTDAIKLSASIQKYFEENKESPILLRTIGAGALNQAVKGAIISNKYFCRKGSKVALVPSFKDLDNKTTAIQMKIVFLSL